MRSFTKNRKSNEEIIQMIKKGLGNIQVMKIEELTERMYRTC